MLLKKHNRSLIFKTMNLEKLYKSLSTTDIYASAKISEMNIEKPNISVYQSLQNDFVSQDIRDYFLKCKKQTIINISKYDLTMNLYYHKDLRINLSQLILTIKRIIITRTFFNINGPMVIHFICSPYKRYFPQKGIISSKHINGGFTDITKNEIFVTRVEEYSKVLIHEVLHHCHYIHGYFSQNNIQKLKQTFNISEKTILLPNEAVVEFWATILTIKFISFETKIPFKLLYDLELHHSICQSARIVQKQGNKEWDEKTNSYCYIVFKTILLAHVAEFLKNYTFPYDDTYITDFIINYKNKTKLPSIETQKSLRMMMLSD